MKIIIEEYNPVWKIKFQEEKNILTENLSGEECIVEHIGSTSVEGLGAKPVIDIMIGLSDFSVANNQVEKMVRAGYL